MEIKKDNRRSESRERLVTPVLYMLDKQMLLQNSYDISASGMSVYCPYKPEVGADVRLRFTHPLQGHYVRADGTVMHVVPGNGTGINRIGIHFESVTKPALTELF